MAKPSDDALYAPPTGNADEPPPPADAPRAKKAKGRASALELLDDTPATGEAAAAPAVRSFGTRAAVTLGAAVLAAALGRIPMPGLDVGALELETMPPGMNASIVALGVM